MTRIAIIAVAVLAALGLLVGVARGIYNSGYRAAQAECKEATIRTELEVKKRDLAAAQDARTSAEISATELSERDRVREAKLHELEEQLKTQKPGDACVWHEPRAGGVRQRSPAGGRPGRGGPATPGRPGVVPASPAAGAS